MTEKRFQITNDVNHGCCHQAAVIDTHFPEENDTYLIVCECAEEDHAQLIADLLNLAQEAAPIPKNGVH